MKSFIWKKYRDIKELRLTTKKYLHRVKCKILLRFYLLKTFIITSPVIANKSKNKYVWVSLKLFINRTTSVSLFKVIQQQL